MWYLSVYVFIVLFILLGLLICLIHALFLIWLGLENWCKHSVSAFIGATLRYIANFRGEAAFDLLLRLVFTLKSFYLWLLVC